MEASPSRLHLSLVAASYVAVAGVSALLVGVRYLQYVWNPQDAAAYSGMYAGGDFILAIFIILLFVLPTAALAFVVRKSESWSTGYAKAMLALSLTAPISIVLMVLPIVNQWWLGDLFFYRLAAVPIVGFVLLCSRWLSRFARARRLISYALLVEGLSFVACLASLFLFS